jgi:hypothetical protein
MSEAKNDRWCFAWYVNAPVSAGADRAGLQKDAKWTAGDTINISFLDGVPSVQERVKKAALKWTAPGLANLTWTFARQRINRAKARTPDSLTTRNVQLPDGVSSQLRNPANISSTVSSLFIDM